MRGESESEGIDMKEQFKKKVLLSLYILFVILTVVGAGYVLYNKGTKHAGYAIVPMIICLIIGVLYRNCKKAIEENKE